MKIKKLLLTLGCAAMLSQGAAAGIHDEIIKAAELDRTKEVVNLLYRGMDVNSSDANGYSLLMIAVRNGNHQLLAYLLQLHANVQHRNRFGDNALMLASLKGDVESVRMLLERTAIIKSSGWNALHYAAIEGKHEVIPMLISAGAEVDQKAPNGQTSLMLAAKRGHLETVRALVGLGADVQAQDADEGTPLEMARKAGHTQVAIFLELAGGARR